MRCIGTLTAISVALTAQCTMLLAETAGKSTCRPEAGKPCYVANTCVAPAYPSVALRANQQGIVRLGLLVGEDGSVQELRIERTSGFPLLDDAAINGLKHCRYQPVVIDGKPHAAWTTAEYEWKIEGGGAVKAQPPEQFSLKEDRARTGTNVKRTMVSAYFVPLDKKWGEFTSDQQRRWKAQYEAMKEGDEPPFPLNGLGPLMRNMIKVSERLREQGDLDLEAEIDSQGDVRFVKVRKSPSAESTTAFAAALMLEKFKPAICSGVPCVMLFPLEGSIKLEQR